MELPHSMQGKNTKRHPVIMLLSLLNLFYERQQTGNSVTEVEALDILGCDEAGALPSFILMLEQQNLIKRTDDNKYALVRNLSQVNFWAFYQQLPYPLPNQTDIENIVLREPWMEKLIPQLLESDQYLAAKLSIPLSTIFEQK